MVQPQQIESIEEQRCSEMDTLRANSKCICMKCPPPISGLVSSRQAYSCYLVIADYRGGVRPHVSSITDGTIVPPNRIDTIVASVRVNHVMWAILYRERLGQSNGELSQCRYC